MLGTHESLQSLGLLDTEVTLILLVSMASVQAAWKGDLVTPPRRPGGANPPSFHEQSLYFVSQGTLCLAPFSRPPWMWGLWLPLPCSQADASPPSFGVHSDPEGVWPPSPRHRDSSLSLSKALELSRVSSDSLSSGSPGGSGHRTRVAVPGAQASLWKERFLKVKLEGGNV